MNRLNTHYCVRGFRSLLNFKIFLTPGVNILVGPNGSGKTNFIEFLDFMDSLIRFGASSAVSQCGGVSRVFSIENFRSSSPTLDCEIFGITKISDSEADFGEAGYFNFRYNVEIKFSKKESQIYISKESVKFYKLTSLTEGAVGIQSVGSIQIKRGGVVDFTHPKTEINKRLFTDSPRNPLSVRRRIHKNRSIDELIDRLEFSNLEPDESILLGGRRIFPALDSVRYAITRGRSFNIIPDRARNQDHISRYPTIDRDGSGLSAILHYLKKLKGSGDPKAHPLLRNTSPESFDMIVNWTSLIFPELSDIYITQDMHSGKYLVQLAVNKEKTVRIPLQSASDGTVKWLALVCLIVLTGGPGCLEEPENFLHPQMQMFLMSLLRENIDTDIQKNYFILSTHSETLINTANPEEIIIFEFSGDGTRCHRISNPNLVLEEINKTGFGLGYYYAANSLG